ncbi:MAG: SDR family NAD(P)-dependent oxidoreductase [Sulfitobacter sp.]
MTLPKDPPPKKNPQKRTQVPTRPPEARSRASMAMSAAAAEGRFVLQVCPECDAVQYPPRDACHVCLNTNLNWKDVDPNGTLLAETTVNISALVYFRERGDWRVGTVKLDAGPSVVCHLHRDCVADEAVRLINRLDRAGQGVLVALPTDRNSSLETDPRLTTLANSPRHRRALITDARTPSAVAIAKTLLDAGAATVFVGEAESWLPHDNRAALNAISGVEILPLDVTDTSSVQRLAAEIGGKVDIMVNNARFLRPGSVGARGDTTVAAQEIEVNYLGLMRLAQAFGPGMASRTADGANSAVAWVNILSVFCRSNWPDYGCFSAASAAAHSLSQNMRAEFRASGLRVMNVYCGPTDDEWHQPLPPPKVAPNALARSIVHGLREGLEEVYCGDVAQDFAERLRENSGLLERELTTVGDAP